MPTTLIVVNKHGAGHDEAGGTRLPPGAGEELGSIVLNVPLAEVVARSCRRLFIFILVAL